MFGEPSPPEDQPIPPEFAIIMACASALPEFAIHGYSMLDEEKAEIPSSVGALPSSEIAQWDGTAPNSWGSGGVDRLETHYGPGLRLRLCGSLVEPASGFVLLPIQAELDLNPTPAEES